jgi:hypothetical protein
MPPHCYQTDAAYWTDIDELLSEAAVEIGNLDSPENPVAKRLREKLRRWVEAEEELERTKIGGEQ